MRKEAEKIDIEFEVLEELKDLCYDFFEEMLEFEKYLEAIENNYYSGLTDPQVKNINASTFRNIEVAKYVSEKVMYGLVSVTMASIHAFDNDDISIINDLVEGCWLLLASLDNARFDIEHTTKMFGSDDYNDNLLDNFYHIEDVSQELYDLCDSLVGPDYRKKLKHKKEKARETILESALIGEEMIREANRSKKNIIKYLSIWRR